MYIHSDSDADTDHDDHPDDDVIDDDKHSSDSSEEEACGDDYLENEKLFKRRYEGYNIRIQ